jgi:hypothetical protein
MDRADPPAGHRTAWLVVLLTGLLALVGTLTASQPMRRDAAGTTAASAPAPPAGSLAVDSFRSTRTYDAVAVPVRLRIPAVGIDTALQSLGRNADGTVAVPTDQTSPAGTPRDRGPANRARRSSSAMSTRPTDRPCSSTSHGCLPGPRYTWTSPTAAVPASA